MTTKTIFGNKDSNSLDEKITSRNVSLKSISRQQNSDVLDLTKQTESLRQTIIQINILYNKITNSIIRLKWALKELLVLANILCIAGVNKRIVEANGKTYNQLQFPNRWIWNKVYDIYKPYLNGEI